MHEIEFQTMRTKISYVTFFDNKSKYRQVTLKRRTFSNHLRIDYIVTVGNKVVMHETPNLKSAIRFYNNIRKSD